MSFHPGRFEVLHYLVAGLKKTGFLLIEFDGVSVSPIFTPRPHGSVDDLGIFIYIPLLIHYFNIDLKSALQFFFAFFCFVSLLFGSYGFFAYFRSNRAAQFVGISGLISLVIFAYFLTQDTYLFYVLPCISIMPYFFYLFSYRVGIYHYYFAFFLAGTFLGFCHTIRSFSYLPVAIWLLTGFFLSPASIFSKKDLLKYLLVFILGFQIFPLYQKIAEQRADEYLAKIDSAQQRTAHGHPMWHPFYLGFGFLNFMNTLNIEWADGFALEQAKKVAPVKDFSDFAYDYAIKKICISFIVENFYFVLVSIFAKIGAIFYYILRYTHLGLFVLPWYCDRFSSWYTFFFGLSGSLIFPLVSVPADVYCLAAIAYCYLYGLMATACCVIDVSVSRYRRFVLALFFLMLSILNIGVGKLKLFYEYLC